LSVVACQSGNLAHRPATEDSVSRSGCWLRHDIFSSFSFLKLVPLALDILEIFEDYPFDFPFIPSSHSVTKRFPDIEVLSIEPIFAFPFGLSAMDVNWLIGFVSVEKEAPSTDEKYCGQMMCPS
jgi:hypothetical protein